MPDTDSFIFRRKKTTLAAALALTVLLVIAAPRLFGSSEPLETRPAQETIGWPTRDLFGSAASGVMYHLGMPAKSSDPAPIETSPADGPAPTIISTSFSSRSSFEEIEEFYETSCLEIGLQTLPREKAPSWTPDLYCGGRYKGQSVAVSIGVDCKDVICEVVLEVMG